MGYIVVIYTKPCSTYLRGTIWFKAVFGKGFCKSMRTNMWELTFENGL